MIRNKLKLVLILSTIILIGFFYFKSQSKQEILPETLEQPLPEKIETEIEKFSEVTIAFISDANPKGHDQGQAFLTNDLNQIKNQIGEGWQLNAIVANGDMDYVSYPEAQNSDDAFRNSNIKNVPVFYVVGNHELDSDNPYDLPAIRRKYFNYPEWNKKSGPKFSEKTTYSFEIGEIHVTILNEFFDGTTIKGIDPYWEGDVVDELFDWLKNDLRNTDKEHKIVVGHVPAYSIPSPGNNFLNNEVDNKINRDRFWNLLQTERVIGYFSGHDHNSHIIEHQGVYEVDSGFIGHMADYYSNSASIIYAHQDELNNFFIRMVQQDGSKDWSLPKVTTKTRADLETQILINTYERAGTRNQYWIDYDSTIENNPDWSNNNEGKWWEGNFDDALANWNKGELTTGYDSINPTAWGWINEIIDPDPNNSGKNHVYGIFQRIPFTVYDKNLYSSMFLEIDYGDAMTIWLNGTKIFESVQSPIFSETDYSNNFDLLAIDGHDFQGKQTMIPGYTKYNKSDYFDKIKEGSDNLLVVAIWNDQVSSTNLAGAVKLYLEK